MNKNKTLLIVALAFVLLLGGAYFLYGRLSQEAAPEQLAVLDGQDAVPAEPEAAPDPEAPAGAEPEPAAQEEEPAASEEEAPAAPAQEPPEPDGEEAGPEKVPAPDFTVYDLDGNEVHLSDYLGKPVVLNFWASWCGPCQSEMPDFDEAYAELGGDVHFLMVNMTDGSRETVEKASSFIEEQGYSFPVFYDTDSDAAMTYGVYSLPTTLFIDAEGYGIAQATGAINREILQTGIDMILPE